MYQYIASFIICDLTSLAARGDLAPFFMTSGGLDCKLTSFSLINRMSALAISGPSHSTHKPFSWTGPFVGEKAHPHYGQPTKFDFDWVVMTSGPLASGLPDYYHPQPVKST